jgi:hypothetical protein
MKSSNDHEAQIAQLGDDIKKQFEQIGHDVKEQMLKDFNQVLTNDLSSLRSTLGKIVETQNRNIMKQSQENLQKTIMNEFGGSIFGQILGNAILPAALGGATDSLRSNDFRSAAGQSLLEMGSAITRAQFRNG